MVSTTVVRSHAVCGLTIVISACESTVFHGCMTKRYESTLPRMDRLSFAVVRNESPTRLQLRPIDHAPHPRPFHCCNLCIRGRGRFIESRQAKFERPMVVHAGTSQAKHVCNVARVEGIVNGARPVGGIVANSGMAMRDISHLLAGLVLAHPFGILPPLTELTGRLRY
jgi:hypothetical protein